MRYGYFRVPYCAEQIIYIQDYYEYINQISNISKIFYDEHGSNCYFLLLAEKIMKQKSILYVTSIKDLGDDKHNIMQNLCALYHNCINLFVMNDQVDIGATLSYNPHDYYSDSFNVYYYKQDTPITVGLK